MRECETLKRVVYDSIEIRKSCVFQLRSQFFTQRKRHVPVQRHHLSSVHVAAGEQPNRSQSVNRHLARMSNARDI